MDEYLTVSHIRITAFNANKQLITACRPVVNYSNKTFTSGMVFNVMISVASSAAGESNIAEY